MTKQEIKNHLDNLLVASERAPLNGPERDAVRASYRALADELVGQTGQSQDPAKKPKLPKV